MIIGGVAALLAAPKSGRETREDLKRHADSLKNEAQKKTDEYSKKLKDAKDDFSSRASRVRDDIQAGANDLMEEADRVTKEVKKDIGKQPLGSRRKEK